MKPVKSNAGMVRRRRTGNEKDSPCRYVKLLLALNKNGIPMISRILRFFLFTMIFTLLGAGLGWLGRCAGGT